VGRRAAAAAAAAAAPAAAARVAAAVGRRPPAPKQQQRVMPVPSTSALLGAKAQRLGADYIATTGAPNRGGGQQQQTSSPSPQQLARLEQLFVDDPHPDDESLFMYAAATGLQPADVGQWFSHQRRLDESVAVGAGVGLDESVPLMPSNTADSEPSASRSAVGAGDEGDVFVYADDAKSGSAGDGVVNVLLYVHEATKLKPADSNGASDPYVRAECFGEVKETRTVPASLNPYFDEMLHFKGTCAELSYLTLQIFDHDTISRDDLIGSFTFDLPSVMRRPHKEYYKAWVTLLDTSGERSGPQGKVCVSLTVLERGDEFPPRPGREVSQEASDLQPHQLWLRCVRAEGLPSSKADQFVSRPRVVAGRPGVCEVAGAGGDRAPPRKHGGGSSVGPYHACIILLSSRVKIMGLIITRFD
jgi:hypothetical protein